MPRSRAARFQLLSSGILLLAGVLASVSLRLVSGAEILPLLALVLVLTVANHLLTGWVFRRWKTPLARLARMMERAESGEGVLDPNRLDDEIGELARRFKHLLNRVRGARRQTLETARKQANIEKFAALGRLSAGVAHEINNPVGGILTCLETLKDLEPGSDRYREYLQLVRSGLERIGKIVRQLLRFSRQPSDGERQKVDVNAIIEEVTVLSLFHNQKGEVEMIRRVGELPPVDGVPDLLNQVFLNIVLNALQAMPQGGVLTIATWAENGHVHASFEDTGPGIPEENLESIFEPFFTTKKVGVGTGLGLSVALGIVEAHGGTIEVGRGEEDGAKFTVSIPVEPPDVPDPALVLEEAL